MKTLTFILYFIAILGLIEANWSLDHRWCMGVNRQEKSAFLRYVNSAMSHGYGDNEEKMTFLKRKMEQVHGGDWRCSRGVFAGDWSAYKSISVTDYITNILCFRPFRRS